MLYLNPHDYRQEMANTRITLVEDDNKISDLLTNYLRNQHFDVERIDEGSRAGQLILERQPELVILDLMLPGSDGLSICREIRAQYQGKILILTASEDDMDQVAALEMGADDFVNKPIQPRVLLARIRMLLRRQENVPTESNRERQFGELYLDNARKFCAISQLEVNLTTAEFDLLWLLSSHPDEILSREYLVKETRGIEYDGIDRSIDNKVVILRKKLGDNPSLPRKIITVRGKGYLFVPDRW